MDDLANRLNRVEDLLHARTGKVGDIDLQQQGLGVAIVHLEKQVSGAPGEIGIVERDGLARH
jgi:hypothetical protein